ncbi:unnamed protein product [Pipistrellus nathusii]|uniref:Uncharacterized protein n=1 Tax=Pipistrellus nathusii TaxID=59473 RepID=A0ABN9ZB15_PIPNA
MLTFHVNFPGLWGLLSRAENPTYTHTARGAERRGAAGSECSRPLLSEVDLPVSRRPALWDWPNGQRCPSRTPPFRANCPSQSCLLDQNKQNAPRLPQREALLEFPLGSGPWQLAVYTVWQ